MVLCRWTSTLWSLEGLHKAKRRNSIVHAPQVFHATARDTPVGHVTGRSEWDTHFSTVTQNRGPFVKLQAVQRRSWCPVISRSSQARHIQATHPSSTTVRPSYLVPIHENNCATREEGKRFSMTAVFSHCDTSSLSSVWIRYEAAETRLRNTGDLFRQRAKSLI